MKWVANSLKFNSILLVLIFSFSVSENLFLSPQNPFLRHEIRLLQDERIINTCLNTWPYDLGNFYGRNFETSWEHDLLEDTLGKENQLGLIHLNHQLGFPIIKQLPDLSLISQEADLILKLRLLG